MAEREEIRIIAPVDTSRRVWQDALNVGLRFAFEYHRGPAGWRHSIIYSTLDRRFAAYWTASRRIVVRVLDAEQPEREG